MAVMSPALSEGDVMLKKKKHHDTSITFAPNDYETILWCVGGRLCANVIKSVIGSKIGVVFRTHFGLVQLEIVELLMVIKSDFFNFLQMIVSPNQGEPHSCWVLEVC